MEGLIRHYLEEAKSRGESWESGEDPNDVVNADDLLEHFDGMATEIERLRGALEWCARKTWEWGDIDGAELTDELLRRQLLVEVPSDDAFRQEWGEDIKTMLTLPWLRAAVKGGEDG